jgi:hypothetical protein
MAETFQLIGLDDEKLSFKRNQASLVLEKTWHREERRVYWPPQCPMV